MSQHRAKPHFNKRFGVGLSVASAPYLPIAAYMGLSGIIGLVNHDRSSNGLWPDYDRAHRLPDYLLIAFSVTLAVGGFLTVLGGLIRGTRVESAGLVLLLAGVAIFGIAGSWEENNPWPVLIHALAFGGMIGIRMWVLALARRAQERATVYLDDQGSA